MFCRNVDVSQVSPVAWSALADPIGKCGASSPLRPKLSFLARSLRRPGISRRKHRLAAELCEGQKATVLQLPAHPATPTEVQAYRFPPETASRARPSMTLILRPRPRTPPGRLGPQSRKQQAVSNISGSSASSRSSSRRTNSATECPLVSTTKPAHSTT